MIISWNCPHPLDCPRCWWVCFFISVSIRVLFINGCSQWMGAVRMRVQTSDKNITMIHTTPVHQLYILWSPKLRVCKKQIHQFILNLDRESYLPFSSEKVVLSGLNQERNLHRSSTVYKLKLPKTIIWVDFDVRDILHLCIYQTLLSKATYIQVINFFLSVHVFPGNRTHNLCAANAMIYNWATGTLDNRRYFQQRNYGFIWTHIWLEAAV